MVVQIHDPDTKRAIARSILEELRDWFAIDENREKYIRDSAGWIFLAAKEDERYVGFLCLKETGQDTAEVAVMGVAPDRHRCGVGRQLMDKAKETAAAAGYSFLQVKTVRMGKYPDYDRTNMFYKSMGFKEFEVIPVLWGEDDPCQIYVMYLK
ncbi:MAG: GNAT family N-acetyltransferase [Oscillospiraceae bacterium]|nr:GNAT family N-acetyltransferase [Oscillospiraceae bacterium]